MGGTAVGSVNASPRVNNTLTIRESVGSLLGQVDTLENLVQSLESSLYAKEEGCMPREEIASLEGATNELVRRNEILINRIRSIVERL